MNFINASLSPSFFLISYFCSSCNRVDANSVEDRRKEKTSKFLSGLKSKRDKMQSQSQFVGRKSELMDTVRVQMQASYRIVLYVIPL